MQKIEVVPYDPEWPVEFERIRQRLLPILGTNCIAIEHVGSTSVPGLAAKPILDIDVLISSRVVFPVVRDLLEASGYTHRGNLEIPGRESFAAPEGSYRHHLYVCSLDSPGVHDHMTLRDMVRARPDLRERYAAAKRGAAERHPYDIDAYIEDKGGTIREIMATYEAEFGFDQFQPGQPPATED
ncbi:MAG: GrpB family protein [Dehalococcoidia bacterium]